MDNTVYVIGIPTKKEYITEEITSFINDGIPTLYLFSSNPRQLVNGYNFFIDNDFFYSAIPQITETLIKGKKVYCTVSPDPFSFTEETVSFSRRTAKQFVSIIDLIRAEFPNTRIAFCTYGSPYLYDAAYVKAFRSPTPNFNWKVIDVASFDEASPQNFYEVAILFTDHLKHPYRNPSRYDRSGLFFANPNPTIPSDTHTDKTFEQIADETALTYAGKNPIVAWSGGIDSTVAVAAFVKNNIPFRVTVGVNAKKENPELHDYLVANFNTITIPDDNDLSDIGEEGDLLVTGEPADNIFPELKTDFIRGTENFSEIITSSRNVNLDDYAHILLSPVPDSMLYNNFKSLFIEKHSNHFQCDISRSEALYNSYLLPIIQKFPFEVKHCYQFQYFFKFIFNYQEVIDKTIRRGTEWKYNIKGFFDTPDFQRWSITNLDFNFETYSTNYLVDKQISKQYNYDVFKMESLLSKHKYPSLLSKNQHNHNMPT